MRIYYLLIEGKPYTSNKESKEVAGGFINCWIKANDEATAEERAIKYINNQEWEVLNIEEIFVAHRERYLDEPDSLECFEQAVSCGIGSIFYTWPFDEEDN